MAHKRWTEEDDQILRRYYEQEGPDKILQRLPERSRSGVINRASRLGIRYSAWTKEADDVIRYCYPSHGARYCLKYMGHRTIGAVRSRAMRLGVKCNRSSLRKNQICASGDHMLALKVLRGAWSGPKAYRGNWA